MAFYCPKRFLQRLSLFVNVSAVDARYIHTQDASIRNRRVELVPPMTFLTGISGSKGRFRVSFTWAFTAGHFTDATNSRRTASAVNGIIPSYLVADVSAGWSWHWLSLEASCNNQFDARYFTGLAGSYSRPGIISADGCAFFLNVGGRF